MTKMNDIRGEVELTIDGEILTLIPSYENIAAMERALGMGITGLLYEWQKGNVQVGHVAKIVAAVAEPSREEAPVGEALLKGDLPAAITAMITFLTNILNAGEERAESMGKSKTEKSEMGKQKPPKRVSRGKTSTKPNTK